jgi:hypothetical protein
MLTSEAHVETDRPDRYLVQLCRHFNGGEAHVRREGQAHVEWSDTHGTVNFGWGQCTMQATPEMLTLRAEAADEQTLQRAQRLVTGHLDRFGGRDQLKVNWQRSPPPTGQSGDTTSTAPMSAPAAAPRRQRYRTIGLTAVGALAIAVHVWLGGAALAAWRWTSLAADIVLAVVVVKLIAVTAVALRHLAARRSSDSQPPTNAGSPHTAHSSVGHLGAVVGFLRKTRRRNPLSQESLMRSEARVPTPKSDRYAKQLCSHAAWKAPRSEWTPPDGVIQFPDNMGTCRITAKPDHLVLAVEATDSANLARMQQIIGGNIERFASRDGLKVQWVQD